MRSGKIRDMNHVPSLTCPKCRGTMSSYERSGVVVDQCNECRGVFLDRGELERLLDLAGGTVAPTPDPQWQSPQPDRSWRQQQPQAAAWQGGSRHDWDDDSDSHRKHGGSSHGKPRKRSSMLREFLDFG